MGMEIAARPRCTAARAAAVAIAVLLTAAPACADVPSINSISVGGRAPGRPARPARPGRAPRPPRPGRPGRPSRAPPPDATDAAAPQPAPSEPAIEPPPGADPPPPPTDVSGEEGSLRLAGRVDINGFATGAVQVFHDGAFGAVCIEGFDAAAADVACRQMGFVGGTDIPLTLRGSLAPREQRALIDGILAPMVLENLACTGTEERLVDCPGSQEAPDYGFSTDYTYKYYALSTDGCDPLGPSYAFVACGNTAGPGQGDLRLAGGQTSEDGNAQFGRLEVFNDGGWGTICDRTGRGFGRNRNIGDFTDESVNVACKQLGFSEGTKTQLSADGREASLDARRVPIWLAGATCSGGEAALTDCPGVAFGADVEACGLDTTLVLSCFNGPDASRDGNLRLVGGSSGPEYEYGRLEVFLRGFWSTICDIDGFTPDSAQVACKILGYDGGSSLEFRQAYAATFQAENQVLVASLPVGLASVDCNGTESSLLDCTSSQNDRQACGIEGTNLTDATVLTCANTADSCKKTSPAVGGSVRLRGGFGTPCDPVHTGFVEIFHQREWGAICNGNDGINTLAADVICRQLGFPYGTYVDPVANPPDVDDYSYVPDDEEASETQGRFWLDSVQCRGPEEKLTDCNLGQGFRANNAGCTFNPIRLTVACRMFPVGPALEDITTPGAEEGDVRLMDSTTVLNWEVGRLEIFFEGSWSQVCARDFDGEDADVACRQLGFGSGSVGPNRANGAPPPDERLVFPVVALTTPGCTGSEETLLDCGASPGVVQAFESRDCFGVDGPGLTLACVSEPQAGTEGALRLTEDGAGGGTDPAVGVLEVFHAGAWGTVCEGERGLNTDDYAPAFTDSTPAVVCRQLGFKDGAFQNVISVPADITLLPAWLGSVRCVGNEASLSDCDDLDFGNTETCGFTQRLVCVSESGTGTGPPLGKARLTGGSADPGGAWAYGRLEVSDGEFFSTVRDRRFAQSLGRRGAQVACRSLGFTAGAQILSGDQSALPGPSGDVNSLGRIACQGDEATLADCEFLPDDGTDYGVFGDDGTVALVCGSPTGCSANTSAPAQGDVRLVDISGIATGTAPCDAVHFGGVEVFNDGRWGRVCLGRFGNRPEDFVIDATVVCRQLGFRFGSLIDTEEVSTDDGFVGADYVDYTDAGEVVWATDVLCTGKEERLDECFLPEAFGAATPTGSGDGPAAAVAGVQQSSCRRRDTPVFAVACRQFEIDESNIIRRLMGQ